MSINKLWLALPAVNRDRYFHISGRSEFASRLSRLVYARHTTTRPSPSILTLMIATDMFAANANIACGDHQRSIVVLSSCQVPPTFLEWEGWQAEAVPLRQDNIDANVLQHPAYGSASLIELHLSIMASMAARSIHGA